MKLHKLGIIDDDTKLEEHSTIIMDPAYVHINTETEKMVQQFKAEEEKMESIRLADMERGHTVQWKIA